MEDIQALLEQLRNGADDSAKAQAAAAVARLACDGQTYQIVVAAAGGIRPLMELLESDNLDAQEHEVRALGSMPWLTASTQRNVVAAHAIQRLVQLLVSSSPAVQQQATAALDRLAADIPLTQQEIAEAGGIEALVQLLGSRSPAVQQQAATTLKTLAKWEDNWDDIVDAGGIPALVQLLGSGSSPAVQEAAAALNFLAEEEDHHVAIAGAGAIPALVQLLGSGSPAVQEQAAGLLASLARQDASKQAIADAGGIQQLLALLVQADGGSSVAVQDKAAQALYALAWLSPAIQQAIIAADGIPLLLPLLESGSEALQFHGVAALGSLAGTGPNRQAIAASKAIPLLVQLLESDSEEVQRNACTALTHTAIGSTNIAEAIAAAGGVPPLIQLLGSSTAEVQQAAAGALSRLAHDSSASQSAIIEAGGIEPLVALLSSSSEAVQAEGASALGSLATYDMPESQERIQQAGGVQLLVQLLASDSAEVQEQAALALAFIAEDSSEGMQAVAAAGAIPLLAQLLDSSSPGVLKAAALALFYLASIGSTEQARQDIVAADGIPRLVRLLHSRRAEVQQQAAVALNNLARDSPSNRQLVAAADAIDPLVRMLKHRSTSVQSKAVDTLVQLAEDSPDNQLAIEAAGGIPALVHLLGSSSAQVQEHASLALVTYVQAGRPVVKQALKEAGGVGMALMRAVVRDRLEMMQHEVLEALGRDSDEEDDRSRVSSEESGSEMLADGLQAGGGGSGSSADSPLVQQLLGDANLRRWIISPGQLQMGARLGAGSFGEVYKAQFKGSTVAVKMLTKVLHDGTMLSDPLLAPFRAALSQEAGTMEGMRHPNCLQFMGLQLDKPAIITEYCFHGSLRDVLVRANREPSFANQLSWQRRLKLAHGAALGMAYLHEKEPPILHRDLKSDNLLVTAEWVCKVADFNLSKQLSPEASKLSMGGGNPRWLAPEVPESECVSKASDVYSFGIILWELLTWKLPWETTHIHGIHIRVMKGERPPLPLGDALPGGNMPQFEDLNDYISLMQRCWAQDPSARPSFAEIVEELRTVVNAHLDALRRAKRPRTAEPATAASPAARVAAKQGSNAATNRPPS